MPYYVVLLQKTIAVEIEAPTELAAEENALENCEEHADYNLQW